MAVAAVAGVWLWRHPWLLVEAGRCVRDYLDGWAIDVEHGFGLVERAKIALAFGLPILAAGVVLSLLWAVIASVVAMLGRWWRGWRVHWRRLVRDDLLIEVEAVAVIASFQPMTATA